MKLPAHPHLILLRCVVTLELSALIGQAGWAAAFLGGDKQYFEYHEIGGLVTLVICVASVVPYVVLRRSAGPVNVALAVLLAVGVAAQYLLGRVDAASLHIFLGVLLVGTATALTSWTYRHQMPEQLSAASR